MSDEATDRIGLRGRVTVFQEDEDGNRDYLINGQRNHFTDSMLKGLLSWLVGNSVSSTQTRGGTFTASVYTWSRDWNIVIGIDVDTPTSHGMTDLVSKIGVSPHTKICEGITTISDANRYINWNVTWNAGTVSGDVGELGFYLRPYNNINSQWDNAYATYGSGSYIYPQLLCSRLSVASGDFSVFAIDPSKSLSVTWEIGMQYV